MQCEEAAGEAVGDLGWGRRHAVDGDDRGDAVVLDECGFAYLHQGSWEEHNR
jgi:hypothetical protein